MPDTIADADQLPLRADDLPPRPLKGAERVPWLYWNPDRGVRQLPMAQMPLVAVQVFVNDGRWLAQCACGHAQLASKSDHRFYCLACANARSEAEGMWIGVAWPSDSDIERIETLLLVRPQLDEGTNLPTRNWRPDEPIEHLADENDRHGLVTHGVD